MTATPRSLGRQLTEKRPTAEVGGVGRQWGARCLPDQGSAGLQVHYLDIPATSHPGTAKIPHKAIMPIPKPCRSGLSPSVEILLVSVALRQGPLICPRAACQWLLACQKPDEFLEAAGIVQGCPFLWADAALCQDTSCTRTCASRGRRALEPPFCPGPTIVVSVFR